MRHIGLHERRRAAYFEGGELAALDLQTKQLLQAAAVKNLEVPELKKLAESLD